MSYNPNNPNGSATSANSAPVVIASDQSTVPVSAASLPLPSGAATAAKQPALGTAGTPSADVVTVQGKTSMTPLLVDPSGVTSPVSLASVPSHAVTNAGTFAVQAAEADGANTTLGSKADAKSTATDTTAVTVMQVLKQISASTQAPPSQAVTNVGTFAVQSTLQAGSVIIGKVTTDQTTHGTTDLVAADTTKIGGTAVDSNSGNKSAGTQRVVLATDQPQLANALKVDGSAVTQPVSASSLPLPAGASTSAKQPALGTAGSASSDVITVQGVASMTALKVDGSGVTQPVSGTVTANVGTTNGLALDATLTGGTQQSKLTDGTNAANILKSDGTAAGQNAALTAGTALTTSTITLNSGTPNTSWYDMANYPWVSVEILTNTTPATLTFQTSGDGSETNVSTTSLIASSSTTTGPVGTTTSATATFHGPRTGRYFRVSSNNGAGTTTVVITFFTVASALQTMFIAQGGTWTVQPGNTANTTAWKVDGSAVTQPVSLASVPSHAVTNAGTFAVQAASAGDVASGSSDSGNPQKIGGVGHTANPTAVTDGQRVNASFDKLGKQVVVGSIRDLKGVQQTTITSSTSETIIVTAVASTFLDLYGLILTNTSATATKVTIKDSTAGTTRAVIEIPPTDTRGFMLNESAAFPQATVNNNWTATCGTSIASLEVTALFVKNI